MLAMRVRMKMRKRRKEGSYLILTDNTCINFELENTPIANFCTSGVTISVNGISVVKSTIKEAVFGTSYSEVTVIPDFLFYSWVSLDKVDLLAFANVVSIGSFFFNYCNSMTFVDLSALESVSNIGNSFFDRGANLTALNIGSIDASKIAIGSYCFRYVGNISSCTLYADTLALGNTFKAKFTELSNWTVVVN